MEKIALERSFDLSSIDWGLIRSFTAVMRTGNLTRAARLLRITQPTVGRHIRQLETLTGEVLFARTTTGLKPNGRASELFDKAQSLDDAVMAFSQSLRGSLPGLVGSVRITTAEIFGADILPPLLVPLLRQHPELEIELSVNDQAENLLRREADIAVRFYRPAQDDLIAMRIGTVSVGLYASRSYLDECGRPLPVVPVDLEGHEVIGEEEAARAMAFAKANGFDLFKSGVRFRTASMLSQFSALKAGFGIGPAMICLAKTDPALVRILPHVAVATLPMWIVAHDDLARSPRMRAVFDHLVAVLRPLADIEPDAV